MKKLFLVLSFIITSLGSFSQSFYGSSKVYWYQTDEWFSNVDDEEFAMISWMVSGLTGTEPEEEHETLTFSVIFSSPKKILVNDEECPLLHSENGVNTFLFHREQSDIGGVKVTVADVIKVISPTEIIFNHIELLNENIFVDDVATLKQVPADVLKQIQEEEELNALHYSKTMLELEEQSLKTKLDRLRKAEEEYKKLQKEEAQEAAPKFGLG